MARKNNGKKPKKSTGDRIVQIVLLVLIAAGIAGVPLLMKSGTSSGGPGGMPGGPGGGPGGPGGAPGGAAESDTENEAVAVETVLAGLSDVREYIRMNGDVDAESSVNIYPDASGKIVSIDVSLGDTVRRGQTVATVDPSIPGQVFSKSAVTASIGGTVTGIYCDVGETVSETTAVIVVGNLFDLEVVTFVPERYTGSVSNGLTAEIALDAFPGETFEARITEISPVLDSESRTVEVTLSPTQRDPRMKAGMFASIRIVIAEVLDVVAIPSTALSSYYGQDVIYVVEDGLAVMREVNVGLKSEDSIQIIEGLDEGEEVIVRGLSGVTDGSTVRIIE